MLIDTHAHVNFNAYKDDSDEVIRRSLSENVWLINVGSQYSTSKRAVEMAERREKGVYAAVGLHPIHLETGLVKIKNDPEEIQFQTIAETFDYEQYKKLAQSPKVVAIGEIGLDYYWKPKTKNKLGLFKEKQMAVLFEQIDLAKELDLPVLFHCRMAHDDLLQVLEYKLKGTNYKLRGTIHCFTGTWEQAKKYIEMGLCLGLNGIIFKMNLDEVIGKMPMDKILLETDCPYLTPLPAIASAKAGRNEPIFMKYVAEKIAEIKKLSYEEIRNATTQNAKNLFKI